MAEFSGTPSGHGRRFAIVASRFNESITQKLVDGALDALLRHGAAYEDVDVVWVPGAWELATVDFDTPIGFGLLTCDDMAQAEARAGGAHGNKGWDAALAAMEMADLFDRLDVAHED